MNIINNFITWQKDDYSIKFNFYQHKLPQHAGCISSEQARQDKIHDYRQPLLVVAYKEKGIVKNDAF